MFLYFSCISLPYYCTVLCVIMQGTNWSTMLFHSYNLFSVLNILGMAAYSSSQVMKKVWLFRCAFDSLAKGFMWNYLIKVTSLKEVLHSKQGITKLDPNALKIIHDQIDSSVFSLSGNGLFVINYGFLGSVADFENFIFFFHLWYVLHNYNLLFCTVFQLIQIVLTYGVLILQLR